MNEHNTAPLVAEQVASDEQIKEKVTLALSIPYVHEHGPFTFLMNQNHNALRGCITCGQTWVGTMAGSEDDLRWHPVTEAPEEEE